MAFFTLAIHPGPFFSFSISIIQCLNNRHPRRSVKNFRGIREGHVAVVGRVMDRKKNETQKESEKGGFRGRELKRERKRKKKRAAEAGANRPHTRWRLGWKWPCVRHEEHLCLLLKHTKDEGWGRGGGALCVGGCRGKDYGLQHKQGLTKHHRLNCMVQFEAFSTAFH